MALALPGMARAEPAPAFGSAVWGGIDSAGCNDTLNNATCFSTITGASGTGTVSIGDPVTTSSASAQANLAAGYVSVAVSGVNATAAGGLAGAAGAEALVWDTLIFSGAAPGATATVTMSGTSIVDPNTGRIRVFDVLLPVADVSPLYILAGNTYFDISDTPSYSFSQTYTIFDDVPMLLAIGVSANAGITPLDYSTIPVSGYPVFGNATITDPFTLTLPDGVTFTSASQQAVPEPGTTALLVSGLVGLAWGRKRRS